MGRGPDLPSTAASAGSRSLPGRSCCGATSPERCSTSRPPSRFRPGARARPGRLRHPGQSWCDASPPREGSRRQRADLRRAIERRAPAVPGLREPGASLRSPGTMEGGHRAARPGHPQRPRLAILHRNRARLNLEAGNEEEAQHDYARQSASSRPTVRSCTSGVPRITSQTVATRKRFGHSTSTNAWMCPTRSSTRAEVLLGRFSVTTPGPSRIIHGRSSSSPTATSARGGAGRLRCSRPTGPPRIRTESSQSTPGTLMPTPAGALSWHGWAGTARPSRRPSWRCRPGSRTGR